MKVVFVWFRRADVTHAQALSEWGGSRHTSIVRTIPGLKKWVQNHPAELPNETAADGIGELWFESKEAMGRGMNSPEMREAFEDARRFADLEKTYALLVEEKTIMH
jgi:uncharacterized protein (TIGR02118 family)